MRSFTVLCLQGYRYAVAFAAALLIALTMMAMSVQANEGGVELEHRDRLRVCGEPSQLPFSNRAGEGFENKIATLLADYLDIPLTYVWYPRTVGFIRRTLAAQSCDLIMAVPVGLERVLSTNPYYRTAYVMVQRADSAVLPINLDAYKTDPRLAKSLIGVIAGSPPASLIARLNLFDNMRSYHLHADTRFGDQNQKMIDALIAGDLDVALMWGPIAGYYAGKATESLRITPLTSDVKGERMDFRIAFGVRSGETRWKHTLNDFIDAYQNEINAILDDYGVPLLDAQGSLLNTVP